MKRISGLCFLVCYVLQVTGQFRVASRQSRDSRKLFGGYRITPRYCKATSSPGEGPNICMFNHECTQRNGTVVGACMDGFLFGACCQLGKDEEVGDFLAQHPEVTLPLDNKLPSHPTTHRTTLPYDITSQGVSQITATLLGQNPPFTGGSPTENHPWTGTTTSKVDNEILSSSKKTTPYGGEPTTIRYGETNLPPILQISVSNAPLGYTPLPTIQKPQFKPKPPKPDDKYVLVPTLVHDASQLTVPEVTTKAPPSTSYVFSTTVPPRKKPTKLKKPVTPPPKPASTSYVYSSTFDPTKKPPNGATVHSSTSRPIAVAHSTFAVTPEAFPASPSTSPPYVYVSGSSSSARPSAVTSTVAGPGFTVTSQPYPSPAPTVIVLGPVEDGSAARPAQQPARKPVNQVIINNHVTQNIYTTQKPSQTSQNVPSPTVIITPKPTISSSPLPDDEDLDAVVVTSANDLINFPPDRNPNLNLSQPVFTEEDITTPNFVEDAAMHDKVESFVNQIIYGLQEPFNDLNDIVYNRHNQTTITTTTTTRRPVKKPVTTTKKPVNVKATTTKRPVTTRRPVSSAVTTKRPVTTRKPPTTVQNLIENETEPQQNYRDQCGVRPLLKTGRIVGGRGAVFGEFPWQVLVRESTWLGLFTKNKCGGVLISDKYVITAAHCQPGFLASLVAVFGEYDISGDLESRKPISRNVKRVIVHRKYDAATFENDLALLELESPVKFDAHIIPICLPPDNIDYTKRMATVTGWGRLKYGGGVPSVLQEVQVPIMENHVCQDMFRTAGHSKVILDSFLCAGYANGQKDACEGDSGGPLVVQRPDGRYELAGTVSHGIKCAAPYLPGVYMRTTYYKPWITSITGIE